ncbi:MAG: hypothetical protein RIG63_04500 [Coleofasciculus chthonoplastes F3-SA18-01]|uniref:hypothetical protein n=1 Tax=Coleofasciculus chthonoplastes TaxID=64178 RepID=UPI0032F81B27
MSSLYTENSEKWKGLSSIDYFTQFVKAWIPFNAWYKTYYPECNTDRQAIDHLKANPNKIRDKLISLINDPNNEGVIFKSRISDLHFRLERKYLYNRNERITFFQITVESNPNLRNSFTRNRCRYEAVRGIPNKSGEIDIFIYGQNGNSTFSYTQRNGFDVNDLTANSDFLRLSQPQQRNLKACYEEINPSRPVNLLSTDPQSCIQMGSIDFVNDAELLAKGVMEALYKLRNILFHGEIVPDNDTNRVYEPAYQILHTLIQAL